jgi:hypothetical protein
MIDLSTLLDTAQKQVRELTASLAEQKLLAKPTSRIPTVERIPSSSGMPVSVPFASTSPTVPPTENKEVENRVRTLFLAWSETPSDLVLSANLARELCTNASATNIEVLCVLLDNVASFVQERLSRNHVGTESLDRLLVQDSLELVSLLSSGTGTRAVTPLTHLRGCIALEDTAQSGKLAGPPGRCGFLCKTFGSREVALTALRSNRFDLVIVRHDPETQQSSLSFATALREIPLARSTPILSIQENEFSEAECPASPSGFTQCVLPEFDATAFRLHVLNALFRARVSAL